jgi:AraC-like DNA-binding protein
LHYKKTNSIIQDKKKVIPAIYCGLEGGKTVSILYENKGTSISTEVSDSLSFYLHFHSHLELIYMLEGKSVAFSDYQEVLLEKGDIFINFPNQLHSFCDIGQVRCMVFIFPQDMCPDYYTVFKSYVPITPIIKRDQCPDTIPFLLQEALANNCSDCSYHVEITKGYFAVLLGKVLQVLPLKKIEANDLNTVRRIVSYCTQNYQNELSLEGMAKKLHISKYHISHLFGQKLKIGFNDFINSMRIDDACNRLRSTDETITEIAFQVGFSSIRSFNRAFCKQMAVTPSAYRAGQDHETQQQVT